MHRFIVVELRLMRDNERVFGRSYFLDEKLPEFVGVFLDLILESVDFGNKFGKILMKGIMQEYCLFA